MSCAPVPHAPETLGSPLTAPEAGLRELTAGNERASTHSSSSGMSSLNAPANPFPSLAMKPAPSPTGVSPLD